MCKKPITVTVTGAAGQIAYSLLFRIAAGEMLGPDQPIVLKLLDIPSSISAVNGVAMELDDCAFPLLQSIQITDNPQQAFRDTEVVLLVGARPRSKGMERKDLLQANGEIFKVQGQAINEQASRNVKVLVVGNPANTNALIAMKHAPDLAPSAFTAMLRLDQNRAVSMLAKKLQQPTHAIKNLTVWGNHSPTMVPDYQQALLQGEPGIAARIENESSWYRDTFLPTVAQRGAAIIEARGLSSAASAANAAIEHIRDWVQGSGEHWVSMGVAANGAYGLPDDIIFGLPVSCVNGQYSVVEHLKIDEQTKKLMQLSLEELIAERKAIEHLLPK